MQLNDPDLLRHQAYIDGKWCDAPDGSATEIFNPANDQSLGFVPNLGADETRRAIEAAQAAQPAWRALTAKERGAAAQMVRVDAGQSGRSGADHDGRAGQAADRGAR